MTTDLSRLLGRSLLGAKLQRFGALCFAPMLAIMFAGLWNGRRLLGDSYFLAGLCGTAGFLFLGVAWWMEQSARREIRRQFGRDVTDPPLHLGDSVLDFPQLIGAELDARLHQFGFDRAGEIAEFNDAHVVYRHGDRYLSFWISTAVRHGRPVGAWTLSGRPPEFWWNPGAGPAVLGGYVYPLSGKRVRQFAGLVWADLLSAKPEILPMPV